VASLQDVTIYHNPDCGTSRNALAMIRNAGIEPHVIEYLKTRSPGRCWFSCSPGPA
jgi:arsenate reductase-like glutaredoxin family protein